MKTESGRIDWADFLGRPSVSVDKSLAESAVRGESVLITGAGGSIGHGVSLAALAGRPHSLLLLDLSESALYESYRRISANSINSRCEVIPVTGNITDERFLAHLFHQHRPALIVHTAAYKHVPLMERNPFSAIANNAIGTSRLVSAALQAGVGRFLVVSTDKAVNPHSIMGASKRIAELAVLSHAADGSQMNVVRLCNVLSSSGSVAHIFREQAESGRPLTVTHADAQRYFLTPAEAEVAILQAAASPAWGRVLIPDCGEAFHVIDLARYIASRYRTGNTLDTRIEFIGLRPGDKLQEDLSSDGEVIESKLSSGMQVVVSFCPTATQIVTAMQRLEMAVDKFDFAALVRVISELVPGYQPSGNAVEGDPVLEAR